MTKIVLTDVAQEELFCMLPKSFYYDLTKYFFENTENRDILSSAKHNLNTLITNKYLLVAKLADKDVEYISNLLKTYIGDLDKLDTFSLYSYVNWYTKWYNTNDYRLAPLFVDERDNPNTVLVWINESVSNIFPSSDDLNIPSILKVISAKGVYNKQFPLNGNKVLEFANRLVKQNKYFEHECELHYDFRLNEFTVINDSYKVSIKDCVMEIKVLEQHEKLLSELAMVLRTLYTVIDLI